MTPSTHTPLRLRKSQDRGHTQIGWLDSYHTFSFGEYYAPAHMGFSDLRVINEDWIAPGQGFGTHSHRDMEIITYVLSGTLEHKDSLGNGSLILPGEVQRMSAGSGIFHSEFNPSAQEPVHLLQIWILPNQKGLPPSYAQKQLVDPTLQNQWQLLVSPDGRNGSLSMQQDALLWVALFSPGGAIDYELAPDRAGWLQVARGGASVNGVSLSAGDGIAITETSSLHISPLDAEAELLLFDLKKI